MTDTPPTPPTGTKTCPSCAEQVQEAAQVCRFCGYDFNVGVRPTPVAAAAATTNGKAIASLILGILWIGGLGSLLAVILGHSAKKEIDNSGGREGGRGIAVAGLILGWLGIAGIILMIVLMAGLFVATDATIDKGLRADMEASLKNAATAQESYATTHDGTYTSDVSDLYLEGFSPGLAGVSVLEANADGYCLEAVLNDEVMHFDSSHGAPEDGGC